MKLIQGTYRDGRIALDHPVDWPEGVKVSIVAPGEAWGLSEADWPDTPENRAALVALLDGMTPLILTPEDEQEMSAGRAAAREASLRAVRKQMGLPQ
jgi:hypothetical protein